MKVKDICNVLGDAITVKIYTRIKYSDTVIIPFHTNVMASTEFKELVRNSDLLASKQVDCLSLNDNSICICFYNYMGLI